MALSTPTQLGTTKTGTTGTSLTTDSASVTSGALLVVVYGVSGGASATADTSTISDTYSDVGTWTKYSLASASATSVALFVWVAQVGTGGSGTITATAPAAPTATTLVAFQITGQNTTTPIAGNATGTADSTAGTESINVSATPVSGDYIYGFVCSRNDNDGITPDANFTEYIDVGGATSAALHIQYRTGTTATGVSYSGANTVSNCFVAFIVKEAGGGATVNAVEATATTQAEVPAVTASSTVTGVEATATAQAEAPAVGVANTVVAVEATATAQAETPTVTATANIVAVEATATTEAVVPVVSAGATIAAVEMTATAQAEIPTVEGSGGGSALVEAVEALANATAQMPSVKVITYTLTLPATNYPAGRDLLWSRIYYRPGTSIVKKSGVYSLKRFPNVDGAEIVYLGGRVYTIPTSEFNALTAAGFGSLLTATEVTY